MEPTETVPRAPQLQVLHTVRCLSCDAVYSKPSHGGTVTANPGCPECGYLGWITSSRSKALALRSHFDVDLRQRHSA
jgi:hypothetical protein